MKYKNNIMIWLFGAITVGTIILPLLIKVGFIRNFIKYYLDGLNSMKGDFISLVGAIIGAFLAVIGALIVQHIFDELKSKEEIKDSAGLLAQQIEDFYYYVKFNYILNELDVQNSLWPLKITDKWEIHILKIKNVINPEFMRLLHDVYKDMYILSNYISKYLDCQIIQKVPGLNSNTGYERNITAEQYLNAINKKIESLGKEILLPTLTESLKHDYANFIDTRDTLNDALYELSSEYKHYKIEKGYQYYEINDIAQTDDRESLDKCIWYEQEIANKANEVRVLTNSLFNKWNNIKETNIDYNTDLQPEHKNLIEQLKKIENSN